jgi:uncharacterized repeat protein (TIGR03837 family)
MLWDIFCRVIDNFGDIGVSWRLSADLAERGERVRLWVDDSSALQWMAPGAVDGQWPGIEVLPWLKSCSAALQLLPPADVWIETFGCDIPEPFVAHRASASTTIGYARPVWINLEYLSAEPYVERSHGLPSPVMQGPAKGWVKHFYYPGFSPLTGGLLREPGLMGQRQEHDSLIARAAFLQRLGLAPGPSESGETWVSLFCYEPPLLGTMLAHWANASAPVRLLVTPGRAARAVQAAMSDLAAQKSLADGSLRIAYLPTLSQPDFDRLLWNCDINFVRGEDSVVRAIWAGKPFVWHIYPQQDQAHAAKLDAFLQRMQLDPTVGLLHRAWNGLLAQSVAANALRPIAAHALQAWQNQVRAARARLLEMDDLGSGLRQFVLKNR